MSYIFLILSGILFGGIVFYAKVLSNMGATLFEVIMYPNLFALLGVTLFARKQIIVALRLPWAITMTFILAMFFIVIGQYSPLFLNVPVTLVVLLLYLQPLWTILIEHFYFKESQRASNWFWMIMMLVGLMVLINPFRDLSFSGIGMFLALLGGVGISLWIIITKYLSEQNLNPYTIFWMASFYSVLSGIVFYLILLSGNNEKLLDFSFNLPSKLWWNFIFYGLVILTLPNILLFASNKNISATRIGMILLLEPVTSIILDVLFLKMILTWNIILGGGIILVSNIILIYKKD